MGDMRAMGRAGSAAVDAAHHGMGPTLSANETLHMRLTPTRPPTPGETARAAAIARDARAALERYRDVRRAEADGYRQFLPNVQQPVYHFTNWRRGFKEAFRFDPAEPTSLLYRKNGEGSFTLVGAMYTAPDRISLEELDKRIPLSVARWHEHVNWCLPKKGDGARWRETRDGNPVFGPKSPIVTQAACDAVRGDFRSRVFGWMVHANLYATEPALIWGHEHAGGEMSRTPR